MIPEYFHLKRRKWYADLVYEPIRIDDIKLRGSCDLDTREIEVNGNLSHANIYKTFIHEYLHAWADTFKIKLPHRWIYLLEGPIYQLVLLLHLQLLHDKGVRPRRKQSRSSKRKQKRLRSSKRSRRPALLKPLLRQARQPTKKPNASRNP